MTAQEVIERLSLRPLDPEGGYFIESYRSTEQLSMQRGPRALSTSIYYLLTSTTRSRLHRLASDEIWHFYLGDPVEMLQLFNEGEGRIVKLGPALNAGQYCQVLVPRGTWQGARVAAGGQWALMGCTVSPGFEFADFELGGREELLAKYPDFQTWIVALT
jgi:predicted cupin superfamily sugar epimerase